MSAVHELQEELVQTETAQFVTTMLRDISATRLQSIRTIFDANKTYYTELHTLMALVQAYATGAGVKLDEARFGTGKIYVVVTSNKRFYGQLNYQVIKDFVAHLQADPTAQGLVIGLTGQQLLERVTLPHPVSMMSFATETPTSDEITTVIAALHRYNEVMVIHPTFINSFRQEPLLTDVTHVATVTTPETKKVEYICEPDIVGLLEFFRTQIRFVLFDRVLLETRLALTGARLMKMQRARERAKELVKGQRRQIHKVESSQQSMRLLETFTGFKSDRTI
jgi:F0F1-type ATP synthase gamma subunit